MSENAQQGSPAMTAGEFRMIRESLGLPVEWMIRELGNAERTVRRWQAGTTPIPEGVAAEVYHMRAQTLDFVDDLVDDVLAREPQEDGSRWIIVDTDGFATHRRPDGSYGGPWPEGWARVVLARVLEQVPGARADIRGEVTE